MFTTTPDAIRSAAEERSRSRLADAKASRLVRRLRHPSPARAPVL